MKRKSILVSILLCAVNVTGIFAQSQPPGAPTPGKPASEFDPEWSAEYVPFRIAGNLYYVGTRDLASYVIATKAGLILINTGLAESVPLIKKNIESLGFKYGDIKVLLTGQAHFDHVAGLAEIKKATGARMMVHEGDAQVLADGGKSDFLFAGNFPFAPVKADRILHDGDTIQLGEAKLVALHHPGHTKGSTSFLLDVADENRTWRVLIVNMPSILPQTRLMGMPSYPNVGKDYAKTLELMSKLKFDLWVASHASQFQLHEKHQEGDSYHPEAFADQSGFEASVNTIKLEYNKRIGEK